MRRKAAYIFLASGLTVTAATVVLCVIKAVTAYGAASQATENLERAVKESSAVETLLFIGIPAVVEEFLFVISVFRLIKGGDEKPGAVRLAVSAAVVFAAMAFQCLLYAGTLDLRPASGGNENFFAFLFSACGAVMISLALLLAARAKRLRAKAKN